MEEIIKLSSVDKYCEFFGMETQNPLVAVIDLKDCTRLLLISRSIMVCMLFS